MAVLITLRSITVLASVLILPGWFLLTCGDLWRQWQGLQRWLMAVSLSIAVYPVAFYWMRLALPAWTMGPVKMGLLLALCGLAAAWRMRTHWRSLVALDHLEWAAVAVFGMTLFTRFWVVRNLPYPAWSDSLHHTLLTELTALRGQLPTTLEPYAPVPLGQYHLGLYSLTAVVEWLADVPAHTALLWASQALNGLCAVGVYLVLDRKVGRSAAVAGAAVAGLLSHQPAFYVNWGRFTQASSQAVLLSAWLVTWEAIVLWKRLWPQSRAKLFWVAGLAAILNGAVFLLHFRVALFYLPLLALAVAAELWNARRDGRATAVVLGTATAGVLSAMAVAPAAWAALRTYIAAQSRPPALPASVVSTMEQQYFEFPWHTVPILVSPVWLLALAVLAAAFALTRHNKMGLLAILWTISLYCIGNTYRLGIPVLNLTNLGAVLIMLYLPIALVIGAAIAEAQAVFRHKRLAVARISVAGVLAASFVASHVRASDTEPFRYFVTPEDAAAMQWIRENTEPDATFAVNTYFWLPCFPHGTDAGYWIPYFTGRQTTAGVMLFSLAPEEYWSRLIRMSEAAERLATDNTALSELESLGVDYVYIGARGDFSGPGLLAAQLDQAAETTLAYRNGGVYIYEIASPSSS